mmetsp:Transcript_19782/g.30865  ORF Transcript_19782/g.30865 Transcript_19782/m.30865 type:complete len:749 (-) Transcript_19782:495-2741(-)|eukprot:CAMPEP_0201720414 /NCGR_PEP_ID=MMETSP0593-20130828/5376_1 /ASSEMBLY_ACC=CAM_ASM_000672 /TAXON_ID=267983 /ORGANISM="Skeletonema japonicum, Strain CCMP2506" /LENGTH=748 /DNA_ID=CAMNT_0048211053 /DNA_START=148 /DNA_END=2394 /DNA_ORIENTATION=-
MATRSTRAPLGQRSTNIQNGSASTKSSLLGKKDSSSSKSIAFERKASDNSNNKGISSMSSNTLRRALSASSANSEASSNTETGASGGFVKKQYVPSSSTLSDKTNSSDSIIIEHRKRPNGDGYTVHKYMRGKLLGKGGFAKVYQVTSLDTNKIYAAKIVPKANLIKNRARQKLQTEIKIHRTMKHVNVCEYKHFFEDKTNCYILLEICHNQSCNEMIKRRKSLTEEETRFFMLQLIDAVSFMHDSNVIHRDLKLGNLFLSKTMNIKVGDFGLAVRVDSSDEKRKTICGTPNYIAPEVINGNKEKREHSFEVDIWSMGVICFTMLVGKPPYESKDVKSTYRRILNNEYSFPKGKVSSDARAFISSMLQSDPSLRPSLTELRQHAFIAHNQIPGSIPSSCTYSAPLWSTDEFGELQVVNPTSALDINISNSAPAPQAKPASSAKNKFAIYDEVQSTSKPAVSNGDKLIEKLSGHVASCCIDDDEVREPPPSSTSSQDPKPSHMAAHSEEASVLERMHSNLDVCLTNFERIQNGGGQMKACAVAMVEETKWVSRFVDYTSKYGLGFLLNDGSSGVYFNDSTKAVLSATSDSFVYIERRKPNSDGSSEPLATYTLSDYPENTLKKKVTLLQHFRNFLSEQQKRAEDTGETLPITSDSTKSRTAEDMIYMKKWIKTKHAMLFRLSNDTVQVQFNDETQVLISSEGNLVTFVDKDKNRTLHSISDIANNQQADVSKRLKYAKEILSQLIIGSKR